MNYEPINVEVPRAYLKAGLCVLPASAEQKRPLGIRWKEYRHKLPTEEDLQIWFREGMRIDALAIVTGTASSKQGAPLFCLDCDDADQATFGSWFRTIEQALPSVAHKLTIEKTPGGEGKRHVFWRVAIPAVGNQVFARSTAGQVRFESRFEGGLVIVSPSKSGGYKLLQGDFQSIPTITEAEHSVLLAAAREYNEYVEPTSTTGALQHIAADDDTRPGADYNRRGAEDFVATLDEHGWQVVGKAGNNLHLRRPAKDTPGISATFNGEAFYVFSTNAAPFEANKAYSPFHAYTLLAHNGNYSRAAADLAAKGYGGFNAAAAAAAQHEALEVAAPEPPPEPDDGEVSDPGPLDIKLLQVPGFITDIAEYTESTAARHCPILSYAGAIAFVAHLAGLARCRTAYADKPNLYMLCLAPSAAGKSFAMRTNRQLADLLQHGHTIATNIGSGPGLEDAFIQSPTAILATIDEFQKLLGTMRSRDSAVANGLAKTMLEFYTASNDIYHTRKLAVSNRRPAAPEYYKDPHLTVHASGIAEFVFQNLTVQNLSDGLLGRFLLFETDDRGMLNEECTFKTVPTTLEQMARLIRAYDINFDINFEEGASHFAPRQGRTVSLTEDARVYRKQIASEADRLYDAAAGDNREAARALWGRCFEKAMKLGLVFAVSATPEEPVITQPLLERAWKIAEHSTRRLLYLAETYTAQSPYDEMAKRVIRYLRDARGTLPKSALTRRMRVSVRDLDQVLETLLEGRQIAVRTEESSGGRKPTLISLVRHG